MKTIPVLALCVAALLVAGCGKKEESPKAAPAAAAVAPPTELQKTDVVKGTGEGISLGQVAVVHYTGWLFDPAAPEQKGTKFDSSRDRGEPIEFTLFAGDVIPGWDQGISGMKVGEKRTLVVPPNLAYGRTGSPPLIPPNATLVFDVELTAVK